METLGRGFKARGIKFFISTLILLTFSGSLLAATVDWKGGTSGVWSLGANWSTGSVPASGDAVRIGVVSFTNQPTISSATATTVASLTFGIAANVTLTVNSTFMLTVSGAITQNGTNTSYGTLITTLAGGGSILAGSLAVGSSATFPPLFANNLFKVVSTITSLHITGNVTVNATDIGVLFVGVGYNNAYFSLQGGTTLIDGTLLTTYTNSGILPLTTATPIISIDMPTGSALTPVLQLSNAAPINTASITGSIDFYNNTGGTGTCTVNYTGAAQTVYTTTTTDLDASPSTYQYLILSGSNTKTVNGGTLTVAKDMTTTTMAVDLSTNNPTVTISNNFINSSNTTQGSGSITVSNQLQNNANTLALGSGGLTVGTSGIQINGGTFAAGGGLVTDNGLVQNNGGAFNCGSGNIIIYGLYQNNSGSFTASTGTVFFSGASQSLSDASSGTVFNKVTFNGSGTAVMSAGVGNFGVSSTGVLTMVSPAKLTAGSASAAYLTLKSDTNGTATVAAIPSGSSIGGFVTVQRFVQGSAIYNAVQSRWKGRNYRLLSSPVNEGTDASSNTPCSLNYLGASTIITNCTSTYGTTGGNPSLYVYNEQYPVSNATFTSGNFIGVTNISNTTAAGTISTTDASHATGKLYAGEGFMMYFRGDKVTHISGSPSKTSYPYVTPESVTFNATGNLNQGTYSVVSWTGAAGLMFTTTNATSSQGYNLVGNPYASSIDWSTFSNSVTTAPIYGLQVDPTIYIFNPQTNNYDTYLAGGSATGSASKIIPSGQGFYVHAKTTGATLKFNETAKTNTLVTGSNLLMGMPAGSQPVAQLLRLKLITDSINYDDIAINFNAGAALTYNANEDSQYLPGLNAPEGLASTSADGVDLSVNSLPLPGKTDVVIKLLATARFTGQYSLKRTQLDAIPAIYRIWLRDNYKKDSLDIRNNTDYVFNIDLADTASFGRNRFEVVVRQDPTLAIHLLDFTATKAKDGAQIAWKTENEQNYTHFTVERSSNNGLNFDVLGGTTSNAQGTYGFMDKAPPVAADQYRLKIEDLNGTITYSNVVTLMYAENSNNIAASNLNVYPNPSTGSINLSINQVDNTVSPTQSASYNIKIVSMNGLVMKTVTSASTSWHDDVSNFSPGTYLIQVVNNSDKKVVGKSMFTKF